MADGLDFFVVVDSANAQKKLTKGNINISGFNNDSGFTTTSGTVTSVSGGNGLTGTVTTSGSLSVGAGTGVTVTADAVSIGQAVATSSNVRFNSIGVGTTANGSTGQIRATSNIISNYSDIRLKNIESQIPDALEKVKAIGGYYYTESQEAKDLGYDDDSRQVGVIAQEVEKVLPELILENEDDGLKSVAYSELTAVLINAVKEQQVMIEDLKARIEQLEK